ncbi:MAG: hypothetical protein ACPG19_05800 [Saprospiraceae bacterium]
MQELLDFSLSGPIIGYTIFFMIMILYWLLVIVGAFDLGSADIDFDFDADIDVDVDVDVDIDADVDADVGVGGILFATLKFFNFGRVPFMLIMTFLSMSMWAISVLVHERFSDGTWLFSLVVFIPILFVGLIITKIVTMPFIGLFTQLMKGDAKDTDFTGLIATTILPHKKGDMGQIELLVDGRDMRLNSRIAEDWEGTIPNNVEVIITGSNREKNIFFIKPLEA